MTSFEEEVANDIAMSIIAVNKSDMQREAKIVCCAALYLFAWLAEEHKSLLKEGFLHVFTHLMMSEIL